jgi:tetratricopeptide (TPR) repeat protein
MSELRFRLGELLEGPDRCPFLDDEETMRLVDGRLPHPRLEAFERHAAACPACRELADDVGLFHDLTTAGVTVPSESKAFERTDGAVRRALERVTLGRRLRAWLYWLTPALAMVVLLLLLRPEARMIADLDPVPVLPPPVVRSPGLDRDWQRIATAWQEGDLERTAELLQQAVAETPQDADLLFYLGQAQLLRGREGAAIELLERVDALQRPAISEHTRWMLAAALERSGREREACAALRSVVEIGGTRAASAREIVKRRCREFERDQSAP